MYPYCIILFSRSTILVQLDTQGSPNLAYEPGDHVAIFPTNDNELVQRIVSRIKMEHTPETTVQLEIASGSQGRPIIKS